MREELAHLIRFGPSRPVRLEIEESPPRVRVRPMRPPLPSFDETCRLRKSAEFIESEGGSVGACAFQDALDTRHGS